MDFHPYLVHFPIALLFLASGWYVYGLFKPQAPLASAAIVLHLIGLGGLLLAIFSGNQAEGNLVQTQKIHALASQHELLSYVVIWAFALLALWHYLRQNRFFSWEKRLYVGVFLLFVGLMAYSASLGGKMVYEEGAGVKPMQERLEQQFLLEQSQD